MKDFAQLIAPIAPHLGEELWELLGHRETITYQPWPEYEEALTIEKQVEIVVQVNGKIVERINIPTDMDKDTMLKTALELEKVKSAIQNKTIRKEIVIPGKLVNIVVS